MLFICWPFTEKTPQLHYKNYDGNRFASFCFPCFFNLLLLCCCYCCCFLKIVHNALNAKRCLDGARPLASQSQTVACLSPVVSLGSPLSQLYLPAPPWHCLLAVFVVLLIKITDIDTFRCAVARTLARTDKVNTDTLVSFTGTVVRVAAVDGILRCYISS